MRTTSENFSRIGMKSMSRIDPCAMLEGGFKNQRVIAIASARASSIRRRREQILQ